MAAVIGALRAELAAGWAQWQADLGKAAGALNGFAKQAKTVASGLESTGARLSLAITAPFLAFSRKALDQAKQMRDAQGQLQAAIQATGNRSGYTAGQLNGMATALQNISTFDNDSILRNVTTNLLQFGNVAGTQFARAQQAAVNLASRLGGGEGGLQDATLKIGRALNDPIKGITALTRAGVQFTTAEKAQITAMVQHGQGIEAQNLILAKMEKAWGGAAEAMRAAQPDAVAQQDWKDFQETIGNIEIQLLPTLTGLLKDVTGWFQSLSPEMQKNLVKWVAIAAVVGPIVGIIGSIITVGTALLPVLAAMATFIGALSIETIAWAAALAAIALAVVVFWKSIQDVLHGDFEKAWTDAKDTAVKMAGEIKGVFDSFNKPQKPIVAPQIVPPPAMTPKPGTTQPPNFDLHNADAIKKTADATKSLNDQLDAMNNKIAHGLDDVQLPRSVASANALNAQIDDYVKHAQEAGVNTATFAAKIAQLRARIEELKQAGLAKEAQAFTREVDRSTIAVKEFAGDGLPPLQEKLDSIDDKFQSLHDKIQAQIDDNKALAEVNDAAAKAMARLQDQLTALDAAHVKATQGALAQYDAEKKLADLQAQSSMLDTKNAIRDFTQQIGAANGPISSTVQNLQAITDDLAKKQIDAATTLATLQKDLSAAQQKGDVDAIARLKPQVDLAQEYFDLVKSASAEQIDATQRITEAFKSFTDDLTDQLSDMIANWSFDLKGLMGVFRQLAEQLFIKPVIGAGADMLGGFLKSLLPGAGGGVSPVTVTPDVFGNFAGMMAGGGSLNPGEWAIAGENGPEPIWAGNSGLNVMSHDDASKGGLGGNRTVVQNITTPDAGSFRRSARQLARQAKQRLSYQ